MLVAAEVVAEELAVEAAAGEPADGECEQADNTATKARKTVHTPDGRGLLILPEIARSAALFDNCQLRCLYVERLELSGAAL